MTPPLAAVRDLWDARIASNDPGAAVGGLRALVVRDAGARTAIDRLVRVLEDEPGSVAEAGGWYQVLVSWPTGFPPQPAHTPIDRYPFDPAVGPATVAWFDPVTGERI